MANSFNPKIESLRGLAAIAVVITHCCAIFSVDGSAAFWTIPFGGRSVSQVGLTVITWLFDAGFAVVLFMVISGYVLALSLYGKRLSTALRPYLVRRAFRLLPPMWFSILLFLVVTHLYRPQDFSAFSTWYVNIFATPPTALDALKNIALVDFKSNPVTWTMYVEVIGSMIVPPLYFCMKEIGARFAKIIIALLLAVLAVNFPSLTVSYLICFACGVMLAVFPGIARSIPSARIAWPLAILIVATGFMLPYSFYWIMVDTIAATTILACVIRGDFAMLDSTPCRFIGRISYSLYLVHLPMIYCVSIAAEKTQVPHFATACISIAGSLLLASLMYRAIEVPAIATGRAAIAFP